MRAVDRGCRIVFLRDLPIGLAIGALLASAGVVRSVELTSEERARLQRESLGFVWYAAGPRPARPDASELERVRRAVQSAPAYEREELLRLYGDDVEMWCYATRDSDGDGVLDFRVSDYHGKILEGDTDLDGDGTPNILDTAPYQPGAESSRPATLPTHLDWALQGKQASMVRIQEELYQQLGIALVERSASFTPALAQSVYDALVKVYRTAPLPTLQTIALEERSLLDPDDEEGSSDFAQVLPATRTLVIYGPALRASPVIQLGVLTHEIAHAVQFALDFDEIRRRDIERRNYVGAPGFYRSMRAFGWTVTLRETDPEEEYTLFRPQYVSPEPYDVYYKGRSPEDWAAWLEEIYDEVGDDYLLDPRVKALHIVGDYSMTTPWEWYGDYAIAYLFIRLFDTLDTLDTGCTSEELADMRVEFQDEVVASQWPYFAYDNARGSPMLSFLETLLPMSDADAETIAREYVLGAFPDRCLGPGGP